MDLAQRIVLIAGASSGIGAATALEMARRGARLVLMARRADRLEQVAASIRSLGAAEPLSIPVDLTDPAAVAVAFATLRARLGALDLMVYNAGIGQSLPLVQTSLEQVRRIVDLNLIAAIGCIQQSVPLMRGRSGARLVLVSSVAGLRGMPGGAVYSASKAALEGLGDALRVELAPDGIGVTLVYPSLTRTEFFEHLAAGEAPSLQGKWAEEPETVARALVSAVLRGRRRAVLSVKGRLIVGAARLAPWLLDRMQGRKWRPPAQGAPP